MSHVHKQEIEAQQVRMSLMIQDQFGLDSLGLDWIDFRTETSVVGPQVFAKSKGSIYPSLSLSPSVAKFEHVQGAIALQSLAKSLPLVTCQWTFDGMGC